MITSISRHLSTPIRLQNPKFLLITNFPFSNSSKIEDYWTVLQSDNGYELNLERNLTKIRGNLNGSVVEDIMRRCSIGDRDRSILGLRFFIWAGLQSDYRHRTLMYKRATDIFDISGNPKWFVDILEAYRKEGCLVSVKTFKEILYLCKGAGLAEEALGVLRKMSEFKCMPDTTVFNVVIRLFSEKGDMDVVVGLREEMASLDLYPDMITYAAMIKGFCNVGRLEDAYGLFEIMRQHGCFPNVVAYSAVLDGFCKSGNLDRAMQLLDEMEKEGKVRKPNVVTYTSVIQSFCEKGKITEALAVLDRMNSNGCRPNRITMSILINSLCTEGRIDEAYVLVDKLALDGSVSSGLSFSSLIVSLCWNENVEKAEKLFKKMLASELKPDGLACSSLIKKLCCEERFLDGFVLYCEMEKHGCANTVDSDIYSILLEALCQLGYSQEVVKLVNFMVARRVQLKAPYLDGIVEYIKKSGEVELASHLLTMD